MNNGGTLHGSTVIEYDVAEQRLPQRAL